ncbi:hypothetical protein [Nocardia colli]|uniref:hypothetical protein n=1 Tax=Nocardia colli TaxID=2545717 RepID=UPI0035DFD79B
MPTHEEGLTSELSISIYYSATRALPLATAERDAIARLVATKGSEGDEPFSVYDADSLEPGEIFAGATKLPRDGAAAWDAIQRWCALLTEIRRLLPDTDWSVSVDDHEIVWEPDRGNFNPNL